MAIPPAMTEATSLFGIQERALSLQSQRLGLIANNLANADTPEFKPQDIDFEAALRAAQAGDSAGADAAAQPQTTVQPTLDQNGVETSQQQAAFADAALRYQASLNFIETRMRMLTAAITGN